MREAQRVKEMQGERRHIFNSPFTFASRSLLFLFFPFSLIDLAVERRAKRGSGANRGKVNKASRGRERDIERKQARERKRVSEREREKGSDRTREANTHTAHTDRERGDRGLGLLLQRRTRETTSILTHSQMHSHIHSCRHTDRLTHTC